MFNGDMKGREKWIDFDKFHNGGHCLGIDNREKTMIVIFWALVGFHNDYMKQIHAN